MDGTTNRRVDATHRIDFCVREGRKSPQLEVTPAHLTPAAAEARPDVSGGERVILVETFSADAAKVVTLVTARDR